MSAPGVRRVAVIGAGLAGLRCARTLAEAGASVVVFDKSRGVGGRMATRRLSGTDAEGQPWQAEADHGVPSFAARGSAFAQAVHEGVARGWLLPWQPRLAPSSAPFEPDEPQWVATPSMKAWCQALADGLDVRLQLQVDALLRTDAGWAVHAGGSLVAQGFDHVVLALPPAQAAALLRPLQPDWAVRLAAWPLQPTWTWLGVSSGMGATLDWEVMLPPVLGGDAAHSPIARIDRHSGRPWRRMASRHEVWTAHATPAWTAAHLEAAPEAVEPLLREALEQAVGHPLRWHGHWAHRWRYAQSTAPAPLDGPCWWAPGLGLGVCGDALGGGGVEGAWTSGQALATLLNAAVWPPMHLETHAP